MKPITVNHPWGVEVVWAEQKTYSGKFLIIKEGDSSPLGYHKKRDKIFFVLQGVVQLVLEKQSKLLQEGEVYHIPAKVFHQLCAVKGDATILECGTQLVDDFVEIK